MPGQMTSVLRFLRHAAGANEVGDQSDAALLREFVSQKSEDAFAAILQRHGPLVLAVCRRTLRDNTYAEDAFQATFLVLARKADSIRTQETLPAWLHRVALNISRTIKLAAARRQAHERRVADMAQASPWDDVELRDWQSVLHEEVDQLPEKYRIPVVLCYLQGLTQEEAARRLGWPLGSVKGRLARARERLRTRLERRGLTLTGAALTTALAESASAAVPPALLGLTLRAALSFAAGGAAMSAPALTLAKGAVQTMNVNKLIQATLVCATVGILGVGFGVGLWPETTASTPARQSHEAPAKVGPSEIETGPGVKPAESKAVRVNDVDFQAVIDAACRIPATGAKEPVSLGLRVSNRGEKTLLLNLFDTLRIGLEAADGTVIRYQSRRLRTTWPPPIVLGKGETKTIKLDAWLEWTKNGAVLSLAGTDKTGGFWRFDGLAAGKYRFHCEYENDRQRLERFLRGGAKPFVPEKGQEFWFGAARTPAAEFEIIPPKKAAAPAPSPDDAAARELARRLEDLIKEDLNKLEGTWHMVACEESGKLLAPENTNPNDYLTFDGTTLYFKSGKRGLRGVVTIDPSKNPKWMDHVFQDGKLVYKGIYEFKGDKLRVFMGLPGGERPTEFKTKEGEKLWLRTFERVRKVGRRHAREVYGVALSADGKRLATASGDTTAILWDTIGGKDLRAFEGHTHWVFRVALSADGARLLTGSHDHTAVLWNAATGAKLQTFRGHTAEVSSVALAGDGKHVLTGSWDGTAILWEAATGGSLQTFKGHTGIVTSVAFSSDGKHVVTGSTDKTAVLWEAAGGKKLQTFSGHKGFVFSVALSADGKRLATGSEDRTAIVWDVATGAQRHVLAGRHSGGVLSVALSGDARRLVTGSEDRTAILWDAESGKALQTFRGHRDEVGYVALSAAADRVATASHDKTAILWDAATGERVRTFGPSPQAEVSNALRVIKMPARLPLSVEVGNGLTWRLVP